MVSHSVVVVRGVVVDVGTRCDSEQSLRFDALFDGLSGHIC